MAELKTIEPRKKSGRPPIKAKVTVESKEYPEMIQGVLSDTYADNAVKLLMEALKHAEAIHKGWPNDLVHAVAIMIEEAGEAMQSAINCHYSNGDIEFLKMELAQTGAMCLRAIMHIQAKQNPIKTNVADISGWAVKYHSGQYQLFKRFNGKMHCIQLGKNLNNADKRIKAKELRMQVKAEKKG